MEEFDLILPLNRCNLACDGRLADIETPRACAETTFDCNSQERTRLRRSHRFSLNLVHYFEFVLYLKICRNFFAMALEGLVNDSLF